MYIAERHVKIQVSNIVRGCEKYIYHPNQHSDLQRVFDDAAAQLKGIARVFKEDKISRFIKRYGEDLAHYRMLVGLEPLETEVEQ